MKSKSEISILVLPDLHGRKPNIPIDKYFDYIITPGDIVLDNLRNIRQGFEESDYDDLDEFCENLESDSIKQGDKVLELINNLEKTTYLVPGNWDPTKYSDGILRNDCEIWTELIEKYENINDCEHKKLSNDDFEIIGHGSTSAPELIHRENLDSRLYYTDEDDFDEKDELLSRFRYQSGVYEKLDELFQERKDKKSTKFSIFLSHNAPYKTPLDLIDNENSPLHGEHYGSIITRDLIEKYQPELVICGHIHEGVGICKIGETICLNAGFGSSIYHIVTIDTTINKILKIEKFGENQKE